MRIGFIGTGAMAQAIARGAVASGVILQRWFSLTARLLRPAN